MFRFPPLWFVGLYEVLLGTRDAVFDAQARTAGLALVLALAAFACSGALSYRRHVRKTLEIRKVRPSFLRLRDGWRKSWPRPCCGRPEERAVYGFFSDTLEIEPQAPDDPRLLSRGRGGRSSSSSSSPTGSPSGR